MIKYATPEVRTPGTKTDTISERPLKPCCEETVQTLKKQGSASPHPQGCSCCGNKIEVVEKP